jgi:hypothetical protein
MASLTLRVTIRLDRVQYKGAIMAKWTGWWEQRYFGRRTMQKLVLDVAAGGTVAGSGEDCIGRFTFSGV